MTELTPAEESAELREAEQELIEKIMSGEKYCNVDLIYIMDGEPVDELFMLMAHQKYDDARNKWLRGYVTRFMATETGEKLIDALIADKAESARISEIEARMEAGYGRD